MRVMTASTLTLFYGLVDKYLFFLFLFDYILMAGEAKPLPGSVELARYLTAMRVMAGCALSLDQGFMDIFLSFYLPFYRCMTGITPLSPQVDKLKWVIGCMVLMAPFTISLNEGWMKDGQTLFHPLMAIKTESPSAGGEKKPIG